MSPSETAILSALADVLDLKGCTALKDDTMAEGTSFHRLKKIILALLNILSLVTSPACGGICLWLWGMYTQTCPSFLHEDIIE